MRGGVTAIFGGAFDPVHLGHIKPVFQLLQSREIEKLVFVPSRLHPDKGHVGAQEGGDRDSHRLAMLRRVVRGPGMVVDTREMQADKVSYTVDTLRGFRAELGDDASIAFVMGEDVFQKVTGWRDYRQLLALAHLIVTRRSGCAAADAGHPLVEASNGYAPLAEIACCPAGRVCRFDNDPIVVSSTEVRACLERGEQPRYMIPGVIWSYIRCHRLYGLHSRDGV